MKRMILASCLLAGLCVFNFAHAQVSVSVNFNVPVQPLWGPAGYNQVNYYYMPDIETYYYVPTHQFIYFNNGRWIFSGGLPPRYHDYDLYRGYKVVINEPRPYRHHEEYRVRYAQYRGYYDHQAVLREHGYHRYDHDGEGKEHGNGHAYGHDKENHGHHKDDHDHQD
jgi:hypothetical protein